ncbi:tetratricopeptide repeat protein [Ekhidna sp.]|uniref:tetratricopeptide repeat protein n=1 Tax=Ekhidna sp. TaxID=2608089 RepID=UPI003CCB8AFB
MEASEYIASVNKAITLLNKGQLEEAKETCVRLMKEMPERKGAYLLLAQIHSKSGELKKAENVLKTGLKTTGESIFHANLGIVQSKMNHHDHALKSFTKVNFKDTKDDLIHLYYAKSLVADGQLNEAMYHYRKCLEVKPDHPQALNNMANLLQKTGNSSEAKKYLKRLIEVNPNEAIAYCNLGSLYEKSNEIGRAKTCYEKSLQLDPSLSISYFNLAQLLGGYLRDFRGVLTLIDKGLKIGDEHFKKGLRFYQILYRKHMADWSEYEQDVADLNQIIKEYLSEDHKLPFEIVPYNLSHLEIDNQLYRKVAEKYAKTIEKRVSQRFPTVKYDHTISTGKIKVGYYSPNMRSHPGGLLVRKLFDCHDSSKFEIHAFSLVQADDFVSNEIKDSVDYFHDVSKLDTLEIANFINRTGIDILVSLAFYNTSMNVEVLALRPAPIQMVLVGSHETTGASFIDYVFSDESMIDSDIRKNFSEKIITLPCSLLINSELPVDNDIITTRKDHGLPNEAFVFASFNHPRKLDPETVDTWMKILKGAPDSVLWLYDGGSEYVRDVMFNRASSEGINEHRIIFASHMELTKHWERFRHVDLFLDSFNYNAHVTGIEALRMGVPMITLRGGNHNSRIGSSLIYYSGLSNCTFLTKNDYIERSIQLATNTEEMESLRGSLQPGSDKLIFDTEMQVKYLEKAYQKAFIRFKKTLPSKDLNVGSALSLNSLL